jgi:perosamine synthetase
MKGRKFFRSPNPNPNPNPTSMIPVNEPIITPKAKEYVLDALDSGWVSSAGEYVDRFEDAFAEYIGVKHAVTVTNGTAALHLALESMGVGEGDEVLLPNFTMVACVDAILYTGATPVFVDVDPDTFCIDVDQISVHITERTKAILPVHMYGHACDMDPILSLGIPVIEDAAEAHGGKYKGKKCGSLGTMSCFSFYGNKILTTGEGGALLTDDDDLAARARTLKDLAHDPQKRFWHNEVGFNYRMTNLQAALGFGQLESIDEFLEHKQWMAEEYTKRLSDIPGFRLPITKEYAENVYWMYTVLVEDNFPLSRDALRIVLRERGIDTRDFFYPLASMPICAAFKTSETYAVTEDISRRGLYLPSGLALTEEQLSTVCDALHQIR